METQIYECIVNAEVLAENADNALWIVENRPWINYQDDAGAQHGKLVYLFPTQRLTRVTGWGPIGPIFPLIRTEGEPFERYTFRTYGLALVLRLEAPNQQDAANFVKNRGWFSPAEGVEIRAASSPVAIGTLVPGLIGGSCENRTDVLSSDPTKI